MNEFPLSKPDPFSPQPAKPKKKRRQFHCKTTKALLRDIATRVYKDMTVADVARDHRVSRQYVWMWVNRLRKEGLIINRRHPPRKAFRSVRVLRQFKRENPYLFQEKSLVHFDKEDLTIRLSERETLRLKTLLGIESLQPDYRQMEFNFNKKESFNRWTQTPNSPIKK